MRRIPVFFLLIVLLSSCGKKEKGKTIYGRLKNAEKSWIHLQEITDKGDVTIDSIMSGSDGSFEMKNPSTAPEFYILRANDANLVFLLIKPDENVEVTGDAKDLESTYKVRGSKDSELIQKLRHYDKTLSDSLNKVYETIRIEDPANRESEGMRLQEYYTTEMAAFAKEFITGNLSSLVSLSATKFLNQQAELTLMNTLRDSLNKAYPENRYVKDYAMLVSELNKLPPGSVCPDITLNDLEGKPISLSSLRGKVVLIDFWASWCAPCRRENPGMVELYKRHKGSEFEIFGVSLDENISAWKNAVEKDGIIWPQVSDLKRWESPVVKEFHVEAIPYSILIDREGKIIAKGLHIDELEIKIMEALGKGS